MKLRRFVLIIVVIGSIATLMCCDYRMLINGSEKKEINFNDSKIEISAVNIGKTRYWIKIDYDLGSIITIHIDVVNIEYKGKSIEYSFYDEKGIITDQNYTLSGNNSLLLEFEIKGEDKAKIEPANLGDTIRITAPDFITYNGDTLSLGELILVVGEKVEDKD